MGGERRKGGEENEEGMRGKGDKRVIHFSTSINGYKCCRAFFLDLPMHDTGNKHHLMKYSYIQ